MIDDRERRLLAGSLHPTRAPAPPVEVRPLFVFLLGLVIGVMLGVGLAMH